MIWGPGKLLFIHIAEKASSDMKELKAILIEGKGIKGIDIIIILEVIQVSLI